SILQGKAAFKMGFAGRLRIKHENAAYAIAADGRVVVYMGDDQRHDYIYKFVSSGRYIEGNLVNNRNLLDSGKLYVGKFNDGAASGDMMGTGEWIELDISNSLIANYATYTFANQADVLINARLAGDAVGATKMDRPEWVAVHPQTKEIYVTLTNNSQRTVTDDANPRTSNVYGQIIRWREAGNDAAAMTFEWDLFVLAGNPTIQQTNPLNNGSSNITAANTFNSPDGLGFDDAGRLWIQTDGSDANAGNYANQGNNQMLCADPVTKEIRRFFAGPKGCEVTGLTFTPDHKTMFINVQHPGGSTGWPEGGTARPRSATVIITKNDGGVIGS
ncbi:PhoX family protein, partial [Malikia spinosa]|uniref:PhoX family protein n=1 Tax=Malikia spinosa TaxID=86180 RepID=UPI003FA1CD1E